MTDLFENIVNVDKLNKMSLSELEAIHKMFPQEGKITTKDVCDGFFNLLAEKPDESCNTYVFYVKKNIAWWDGKDDIAFVMAWMDRDGDGDWRIYGKIAKQPSNSAMQEYELDWTDVGDTEQEIDCADVAIEMFEKAERMVA